MKTQETLATEETVATVAVSTVKEKLTNTERYEELLAAKKAADEAFYAYAKIYRMEYEIKGRTKIQEIIELHKQGLTNKEIVARGYNQGTVNRQVYLYKKGKKVEKTTVGKFVVTKK